MAKGVIICNYHTLITQQVFTEFLGHGLIERVKLQLHRAIVGLVALSGP